MWSSRPIFWVISGNKGAFFPSTSGTDGNIYYSKHQSCVFSFVFTRTQFWVNNATLCNGAKKVKRFPAFFGGTFMCCTVHQDSGETRGWLGSERRFSSREQPLFELLLWLTLVFSASSEPQCETLSVCACVCVCKTGYCCKEDLKRRHDSGPGAPVPSFTGSQFIVLSIWRLDKHHPD